MIKNLHTTIKLIYNPYTGKLIRNSNLNVFPELIKNFFPQNSKLPNTKKIILKNVNNNIKPVKKI